MTSTRTLIGLIAIVVAGAAHLAPAADTQSDLEKRGEAASLATEGQLWSTRG